MKIDGACRKLPKTNGTRSKSSENRCNGSGTPEIPWETSNLQRRSTEPVGNFRKPTVNNQHPMKIDGACFKLPKTNGETPASNENRRSLVANCRKPMENDQNPVKIDGAGRVLQKLNGKRATSSEDRRNRLELQSTNRYNQNPMKIDGALF